MWLVAILLALILPGELATRDTINVAVFLPRSGKFTVARTIAPAAQLAADSINQNEAILRHYTINVTYHDTGCDQGKTINQLIEHIKTNKMMDAIIAGACDPVCEVLGLFVAQSFLPMISWGCQSVKFSDKKKVFLV